MKIGKGDTLILDAMGNAMKNGKAPRVDRENAFSTDRTHISNRRAAFRNSRKRKES